MTDIDRLPVAVLSVTMTGTVRMANACLAAWLGVHVQDLVGKQVDDLLTRGGRVLFHTYLMPTLQMRGQVQELSLALEARGETIHALTSASLHIVDGERRALLAMSPMRERLRVEAELLRVQRAADAAPVLLFEYELTPGRGGCLAYASAGLRSLYRLAPDMVRADDAPLWACVHPDDLPTVLQARQRSADEGEQWVATYRARTEARADWAWHTLRARPHRRHDGILFWHGTISDVTRQLQMEQAERERDAAARANRAKSEFLARMSHELRTPLNGIIGFAQLLASDARGSLDEDQRRQLHLIEVSGYQLLSLINEVLDISRIEAGHLQLDLQAVPVLPQLRGQVAVVEPMARSKSLDVAIECSDQATVRADKARLDQVLANLLSNAVKYNRPHGRITLAVIAQQDKDAVAIEVRDTGVGLSEAQLNQLFQPFNRLGAEQTRTEGTGLGLVITRSLVEAMEGRLEVRSTVGEGTTFRVLLPGAPAPVAVDVAPARETGPAEPVLRGPVRRVLYAEDNPVNAMLMKAILEDLPGVDLRIETTAEGALRSATETPPALLLLDMQLPDGDGNSLLASLRGLPGLAEVPAVAVSADAMPEDVERTRAAGFAAYWTKPVDVTRVRSEVLRLLARADAGA